MRECDAIRNAAGQWFMGCGYGGAGSPVPYWTEEMSQAKTYRTPEGAAKTAERFGGHAGKAEADDRGMAVGWLGFLVRWRDGWILDDADPKYFDPNDYEMNNGPL